jgi:hypothetical protein
MFNAQPKLTRKGVPDCFTYMKGAGENSERAKWMKCDGKKQEFI